MGAELQEYRSYWNIGISSLQMEGMLTVSATNAPTTCQRDEKGRLASRVALVLPYLLPWGGAERVTVTIAEELMRRGYGVDLVFSNEPEDLSGTIAPEIKVFNFNVKRLRNFVVPFARYLRQCSPDAIVVSMWPLTSFSIFAHRLVHSRAKLIVCDHNTLSIQYADRGTGFKLALRASMRMTYPMADVRVGVSNGVADDLATLSGLSRSQFEVIHNPIPLPATKSTGENVADAIWGPSNAKRILTVGRFKSQKNHRLLIRAFEMLIESVDAQLMLLGSGELEEETWKFVEKEGLGERVLMPGAVEDPVPYYRSADLFVLSSDYEGFGNVIVEALGCGLPVVSTDCRFGPAEILDHGRYGTLVPVGDADALARAMADALAIDHDRAALVERAADFRPAYAVEQYVKFLPPVEMSARR